MGTIKSNWNSVTHTCGGFSALRTKLRNFITTCFHNCHNYRLPAKEYYHQQQQPQHHLHHHHHYNNNQAYTAILLQNSYDSWCSTSGFSRDFVLQQQHTAKGWPHALRQQASSKENLALSWLPAPAARARAIATATANRAVEECPTIVAKLLSSTPIAATKPIEQIKPKKESSEQAEEVLYNTKMTIIEDTFTQARDEYPDLDAEIRAILMARAQDGATIADIKMDYRKNTGMNFPIFENITSFLLTIPMVAAICNERRTQYFNIVPTSKTKHLFDLVREQKSQQQQQQYGTAPRNWRCNSYAKDRNNNNNYNNAMHNNYYNYNNNDNNNDLHNQYYECQHDNNKQMKQQREQQLQNHQLQNVDQRDTQLDVQQQQQQQPLQVHAQVQTAYEQQIEQQPLPMQKDTNVNSWQDNYEKDGNYYQDNCNHLYSRLYCQQLPQTPLSSMPVDKLNVLQYNNKNNNSNKNIQKDNSYWQSHNEQQQPPPPSQQQQQPREEQAQIENRKNEKNAPVSAADKNNFNVIEYEPTLKRKRQNTPKLWAINGGGGGGGNGIGIGGSSENGSIDRYTSTSYAKSSSQWNDSCYISCSSEYEAHLYDFPLLGDDFLLYLARMELNCKFKKNESVYQSGLCVSGQTIRAAIKRIRRLAHCNYRIIVNIGSVDIMRGRTLLQIEHDYRELIDAMFKKGITPILTTLAPLANYMHVNDMRRKWERFNEFIKREGECLLVIDVWSCLANERGLTLFDCYQKGPRNVTGAKEPYVFWNKIGRQRVLQKIMQSMEY